MYPILGLVPHGEQWRTIWQSARGMAGYADYHVFSHVSCRVGHWSLSELKGIVKLLICSYCGSCIVNVFFFFFCPDASGECIYRLCIKQQQDAKKRPTIPSKKKMAQKEKKEKRKRKREKRESNPPTPQPLKTSAWAPETQSTPPQATARKSTHTASSAPTSPSPPSSAAASPSSSPPRPYSSSSGRGPPSRAPAPTSPPLDWTGRPARRP